jgi:hypothetical protein
VSKHSSSESQQAATHPLDVTHTDVTQAIFEALRDLHYGAVEITVHAGNVVQIERREKRRFDPGTARPSPMPRRGRDSSV